CFTVLRSLSLNYRRPSEMIFNIKSRRSIHAESPEASNTPAIVFHQRVALFVFPLQADQFEAQRVYQRIPACRDDVVGNTHRRPTMFVIGHSTSTRTFDSVPPFAPSTRTL